MPPPLPLPPAEALADLTPPDVDLRTGAGLRHAAARQAWDGIVWGRLGRGDLAWAHWDRVDAAELRPWLAAERGRVLRELGLHARAEALERPAARAARDPVDAAMLRVSLAADAVGLGDLERAQRRFAIARADVAALPDGPRAARQRLRLTWVGVEVALLTGEAPSPDGLPSWDPTARSGGGPLLPADHRWGSRFHAAKGLLFAGVVRGDHRLLEAAAELAPPALAWAVHLARADLGAAGAEDAARRAWAAIVAPPGFAAEVAATGTARRLAG